MQANGTADDHEVLLQVQHQWHEEKTKMQNRINRLNGELKHTRQQRSILMLTMLMIAVIAAVMGV